MRKHIPKIALSKSSLACKGTSPLFSNPKASLLVRTGMRPDKNSVAEALPPGVYAAVISDYNNIMMGSEKREFPGTILLGSEKREFPETILLGGRVLARMYHEHTVSKHYTAVTLGEACGAINLARGPQEGHH